MGAPATESPRISIVIPVFNEIEVIDRLQDKLATVKHRCEVIFADGGSVDGTLDRIRPDFSLVTSDKGRACQMNEGARSSSGDILFFLHADSIPPDGFVDEITEVVKRSEVGCFGMVFDEKTPFLILCQIASNWRCRSRGIVFGDQGFFIDRELFFEVGMFPDIPLMEDFQLSLTLREKGYHPEMTPSRITTSARRFSGSPLHQLRTMVSMFNLRRAYRRGTSIHQIAAAYQDIR